MTLTSEKAPGNNTKTPNKPKGRAAKRMAFYALNRRKALGRAVLKQIRAVMPPAVSQEHQQGVSLHLVRDERECPNFHAFHYGENIMSSINLADIESSRSLPIK